MAPPTPLPSNHHYILLSLSPPTTDVLTIRKSLQNALSQTFGHTMSNTYMDILALSVGGREVVLRVRHADRESVLGAITISSLSTVKFSVSKESSFLPSLVSSDFCAAEAS
ncbi:hypothetical protein F5I97DRAFT_1911492 [Phlebopus sp. FC_14]|nr:hypothetical protein F5I97DRAFT_1911492 [Phlebopus sp. FC_14]